MSAQEEAHLQEAMFYIPFYSNPTLSGLLVNQSPLQPLSCSVKEPITLSPASLALHSVLSLIYSLLLMTRQEKKRKEGIRGLFPLQLQTSHQEERMAVRPSKQFKSQKTIDFVFRILIVSLFYLLYLALGKAGWFINNMQNVILRQMGMPCSYHWLIRWLSPIFQV